MPAKAKTTPSAMLADVLGNAARKTGQAPATAQIAAQGSQPGELGLEAPAPSARKARAASPSAKAAPCSASGQTAAQDGSHKLQIIIPAELYTAMQMHKCLHGRERGENSLKDIGINAIAAYVSESLKEVRRYG